MLKKKKVSYILAPNVHIDSGEVVPQCDAVRAATAWLGVAAYRTFGVAWGRCTAAQSFEFSSYENTLTDIYSQSSKTKGFITFLHSYLFDKITYFSH